MIIVGTQDRVGAPGFPCRGPLPPAERIPRRRHTPRAERPAPARPRGSRPAGRALCSLAGTCAVLPCSSRGLCGIDSVLHVTGRWKGRGLLGVSREHRSGRFSK